MNELMGEKRQPAAALGGVAARPPAPAPAAAACRWDVVCRVALGGRRVQGEGRTLAKSVEQNAVFAPSGFLLPLACLAMHTPIHHWHSRSLYTRYLPLLCLRLVTFVVPPPQCTGPNRKERPRQPTTSPPPFFISIARVSKLSVAPFYTTHRSSLSQPPCHTTFLMTPLSLPA